MSHLSVFQIYTYKIYYIEEILKSYGFIFYNRYSTNDNEGYEKIENEPKEDDEETHPIIYDDTEK